MQAEPRIEDARWDRADLLECFVETRGLGDLSISYRVAVLARDAWIDLRRMNTPLESADELVQRVSSYQSRTCQRRDVAIITEPLLSYKKA